MIRADRSRNAGRFKGRDLSRFSTPKTFLTAGVAIAAVSGLTSWMFAHETSPDLPSRGANPTVLLGSVDWGLADATGLLGAVFVALLPFLQLLRILTSRSVEGLSFWAWLILMWTMVGSLIQGIANGDEFLVWVSVPAVAGALLVIYTFYLFGNWSWRVAAWTFALAASSMLVLQNADVVGSDFMWFACLVGVVPITSVAALGLVDTILSSSSRRACSQAVHFVGTIGYLFWFIQALQTGNVPMAAVAMIMMVAFVVGLGTLLYLGVVSDDGVSAAEVVMYRQVKTLPRAIAMHDPVFDSSGNLIDLELVWANDNWQSYRNADVPSGSKASTHRVRFHELLPHIQQAWSEGRSVQYFRLDRHEDVPVEMYDYADAVWDAEVEVETMFVKMESGGIMEWGDDLEAKIQFGSELQSQRRQAEQRRQVVVARLASQGEQARFRRELHDNVLQELFVLQLTLEAGEMSGLTKDMAGASKGAVEKISKDIRTLIDTSPLEQESLMPLDDRIRDLLDKWTVQDPSSQLPFLDFTLSASDATVIERIPEDEARCAFHIVKEAVANAVKHSEAQTVVVDLLMSAAKTHPGKMNLVATITDDGVGMPPDNTRSSGLTNMQERAFQVGGRVSVQDAEESKDGARPDRPGTRVRLSIPEVVLAAV